MNHRISRRSLLKALGISTLSGAGGLAAFPGDAMADPIRARDAAARVVDGKIIQPQRELPVLHETDVLVVGSGPAGVAAAVAASRTGAKTTLVERYGHLGGQWTGGHVLVVVGMFGKSGVQMTRGIGEEMMARLSKVHKGITGYPGRRPTIDAEALKYVMVEMAVEAEIECFLHCWGVDAVMDGSKVCGAVFESKSGRQAILSKVVIDATGDGDVFAAADAEYEHIPYHIGLVSRIGNVPRPLPKPPEGSKPPRGLGSITPIEGVRWVNMRGETTDALDVRELSRLEMNHRRQIWRSVERLREEPGYEDVYLMETAPQLGVRISRLLGGVKQLTYKDAQAGTPYPDVIGYSGDWTGTDFEWQIPYGALVPRNVDNILVAGRCISAERKMADLIRVIPPCFVTGHAAGVAAAVSLQDGCLVRDVEVAKVQGILREQDAYMG
ncbi:MAG: FAD-dependent oxidoreductase [Thermoguttaceae bacterium]|jgi:hypothetical protein|nr:FAD-dependent oxidoreductase [Thermoguttaceae bacterium]